MKKTDNVFGWATAAFTYCVLGTAVISGMLYCAIADDNHTFPYMSHDGWLKWQRVSVMLISGAVLFFIILLIKEILKRRNFDLDTLSDEGAKPESWWVWFSKTIILYTLLGAISIGVTATAIPVFHIDGEASVSLLRNISLMVLITFGLVCILNFFQEVFRRHRLARISKDKPGTKPRPSHLA